MLEHDLERAEDMGDSTTAKLKTAEVEISRLTEGSLKNCMFHFETSKN